MAARSEGLKWDQAFEGNQRSPVTKLGLPEYVRHFCADHLDKLLFLDFGPHQRPPRDLYILTANCALRALHSPGKPPLDPRRTLVFTESHNFGFLRHALDICLKCFDFESKEVHMNQTLHISESNGSSSQVPRRPGTRRHDAIQNAIVG